MKRQQKQQKQSHRQKRRKRYTKGRAALTVLLCLLCVAASLAFAGWLTITTLTEKGRQDLLEGMTVAEVANDYGESVEAGVISRNGKKYRYNKNLVNILCLGVDNWDGPLVPHETYGESGQADMVMMGIFDTSTKTLKFLSLSRDAMTEVKCYDHDKNYIGWGVDHLSLGFAMGDGADFSCQLMQENVSRLLYGVPVQLYAALSIQKISAVNDSIGGVTVEVPNDDLNRSPNYFAQGQTVTLMGSAAFDFVHFRDTTIDGSNNGRMERQKCYINAMFKQMKSKIAANPAMVLSILDSINGYYLTNIGSAELVYLAQEIAGADLSIEKDFYKLPGQNDYSGSYDEFIVDDEALYDLVLELFYEEIPE